MADNKKKIIDALTKAGEPLRPGDIAEKTKIPKEEVSKLITEMKKTGDLISPKRCFYDVKK